MLKGIMPLLGPERLAILPAMGHGDEIAIVDANYPVAAHGKRLVRMDRHNAPAILDAVLSLVPLDAAAPEAAFRRCAFGDCGRPICEDGLGRVPSVRFNPLELDCDANYRRTLLLR
jgi:L-fucose mutarotase